MRTEHKQAGYSGPPELLFLFFCICFVLVLVFGNWLARGVAIVLVGGFCGWAYWFDWSLRFHRGERVKVIRGPHTGCVGVVQEPLFYGRGARVALDSQGPGEIVRFHPYEIRKIDT